MVMSGSDERVVFVLDAPGDESLFTGGTIARLLADGAEVSVLFGSAAGADGVDSSFVAAARSALGEADPSRWRVLSGAADDAGRHESLGAALAEADPTAVVVASADEGLRRAVSEAAMDRGVPVFVNSRVSGATGQRLTAIDVSDQIDAKLGALTAYPGRFHVNGRVVALADGAEVLVTGTEAYVRAGGAAHAPEPEPPTAGSRALAAVMGLAAGVLFGVLGTVAHQTTVELASVTIPIGLALSVLATGSLLLGLRLVVGDRLVVGAAALGLLATVFLLSLRSTGGSVLVPQGVLGTVWTIVPALVAVLVIAWPRIPARRTTA